jgi:beta-galactosidase
VAWHQFETPYEGAAAPIMPYAAGAELRVLENDDAITVRGSDFTVAFDRASGSIKSLQYNGLEMLHGDGHHTPGPALSVFRAPTNNDKFASGSWYQAGLNDLTRAVDEFSVIDHTDRAVIIEARINAAGDNGCSFAHVARYTVLANGVIDVSNHIVPDGAPSILPRIGVQLTLPPRFETVTWFGRGPHENYIDRKVSADIGLYRSSVADMFVPYVDTQETGNREDVRFVALTDDAGDGLLVVAGNSMSFSALHHTAADLDAAAHPVDLPQRDEIHLSLDAGQLGLGGASCGPPPMDQYLLRAEPVRFAFSLRPYHRSMGRMTEVARLLTPVASPVAIQRDDRGMVRLTCDHPAASISYVVGDADVAADGQPYDGPFDLADGGVVRAVAVGDDLIPAGESKASFDLLIPRANRRVVRVDSTHPVEHADHAIDGDASTFWHTMWGKATPNTRTRSSLTSARRTSLPRSPIFPGRAATTAASPTTSCTSAALMATGVTPSRLARGPTPLRGRRSSSVSPPRRGTSGSLPPPKCAADPGRPWRSLMWWRGDASTSVSDQLVNLSSDVHACL